jgi:spoIIIJ-associated protein
VAEDNKVQQSTEQEIANATEFLQGTLNRMGLTATIEVVDTEDNVTLDIKCEDVELLIGRRGQVVDALQHLVGKIVAKDRPGRGKPIIVDAGGYRDKHIERLRALAQRMSQKALESNEPVALSPMTPHDRRIVHMFLAEIQGVSTHSEGEGEDRHIVIEVAPPVAGGAASAAAE